MGISGIVMTTSMRFYSEDNSKWQEYGMTFIVEDEVVETIIVEGTDSKANVQVFETLWSNYSTEQVLAQYGIPDRVWMRSLNMNGYSPNGNTGKIGYHLWFLYDRLGFQVRYEGSTADQPTYLICPRFDQGNDIHRISMILQSPDNPNPVEQYDDIVNSSLYGSSVSYLILPIERATGLTIGNVVDLILQTDESACFKTPRDIWP